MKNKPHHRYLQVKNERKKKNTGLREVSNLPKITQLAS